MRPDEGNRSSPEGRNERGDTLHSSGDQGEDPQLVTPRKRVRLPLSDGHMDVCISPDASPETIVALKRLGEACLARMKDEDDDA